MYFKVDRKVLKKALIWLKKQPVTDIPINELYYNLDGTFRQRKLIDIPSYIEQIEFALYKTKMDEFYIDYDFAKSVRPALLTKKVIKHD